MSELMLRTVEMKGPDPRDPQGRSVRVFGTWKVVAGSDAEAVGLVDAKFVAPYLRGCGALAVTRCEDYPKLATPGGRLTVVFLKPPSFTGGTPTEYEAYTEDGKTWRWTSNDNYPDDECCAELGIPADFAAQTAAREAHNAAFLAEYRAAMARRSPKERAAEKRGARAAYGRGKKVTNVVTGETYTT